MAEFDFTAHRTIGTSTEALEWVRASSLPAEHQADLRQFIEKFPDLRFAKEDDTLLDHLEATAGVALPPWFRDVRKVLAVADPPARVNFDDFEQLCPRSDDVEDIWYELRLDYDNTEQRELFRDRAEAYPVGFWPGTDRSYLSIHLGDHDDTQIYEFAAEDLLDNVLDGKPARMSAYPVFASYPRLLSHIVACRFPDGTVVHAR